MKPRMNKQLADAYSTVLRERDIRVASTVVPESFVLLPDPNDKFVQEVLEEYKWLTKRKQA